MIRAVSKELPPTPQDSDLSCTLNKLSIIVSSPSQHRDARKCVMCSTVGDGDTDGPGRLISYDAGRWVHLNCALWSHEVYETMNGSLMNVGQALQRTGQSPPCVLCGKRGASVSCFRPRCSNVYHVACAKQTNAVFFPDKVCARLYDYVCFLTRCFICYDIMINKYTLYYLILIIRYIQL